MPMPDLPERLEEARVVLVRPCAGGVEQEAFARPLARLEQLVVEPQVDRADLLLGDFQALDDRGRGVPRDRDHALALAGGTRVHDPPIGPLGAREELGQELVLHVEDRRRRGRARGARDHDGQREVDGVEAVEPPRDPAAGEPAPRHRSHASRSRAGRPVLAHDLGREAVDVVGDRGQEDAVLVVAHPPERPDELARVRLASARDPGDEREQADPDAHAGDPTVTQPCGTRPRGGGRSRPR